MSKKNYQEKALAVSAYCSIQARLLQLYNSSYDNITMLKEIGPLATKAIRSKRKRNLRSLEELSKTLDQRIDHLAKGYPEITSSKEAEQLTQILKEKRQDYQRLCNAQNC